MTPRRRGAALTAPAARDAVELRTLLAFRELTPSQQDAFLRMARRVSKGMSPRLAGWPATGCTESWGRQHGRRGI